jgi:lipopolysaccharide transport system permease protein
MLSHVRELFVWQDLLLNWIKREFRVRYSQSILGIAWAILQPLSLMIIMTVVFSVLLRIPTSDVPYPVFVYSGLLPWMFFANSLSAAIPSIADNFNLVSKVYFPREILPFSAIVVGFIDFLFASSVFVILLFLYRIPIGPSVLLLPIVIVIQFTLIFGLSLLAGAANVFYRDIRFVIPLVLQLIMYLSPIFYSTDIIPQEFLPFYFLNPMAAIIEAYRRILIFNELPNWSYLGLASVVSVLILFFSYRYFKKVERTFADLV